MNSLGYINLFWMRQFLDATIGKSDEWFEKTYPEKSDFEEVGYLIVPYSGNRQSLLLFIENGLKPIFHELNEFQKVLLLDCLALLIAKNDVALWKYVNFYDHIMGNRIEISDEPMELFVIFFDYLIANYTYSLSEYGMVDEYKYDVTDTLELYRFC